MIEHDIYLLIADYMRYKHPGIIYRFDLAADLKLTMGQAAKHKRLQHFRGYPDLFIACTTKKYGGLFIEIKKPGTRILKQDGHLVSDPHIREQFDMLEDLRCYGYKAEFGVGFDECVKLIDEYLADQ